MIQSRTSSLLHMYIQYRTQMSYDTYESLSRWRCWRICRTCDRTYGVYRLLGGKCCLDKGPWTRRNQSVCTTLTRIYVSFVGYKVGGFFTWGSQKSVRNLQFGIKSTVSRNISRYLGLPRIRCVVAVHLPYPRYFASGFRAASAKEQWPVP